MMTMLHVYKSQTILGHKQPSGIEPVCSNGASVSDEPRPLEVFKIGVVWFVMSNAQWTLDFN